tara:strand:+ start:637 stop:1029 length:393 start_codon:yes stop_codon:yes gene_type:complete
MATFAKLDENNIVLDVSVISNKDTSQDGVEVESVGVTFLSDLTGYTNWKKTSYNTINNTHLSGDNSKAFRGNYAAIGGSYDSTNDIFIFQKPFPSWSLNLTTATWDAPVPFPDADGNFTWDENNQQWVGT